jgi:putative membrane protein
MVSLLGSSWPHGGWFWLWPLVPLLWFFVFFVFVRVFFWRGRRAAWVGCGAYGRPNAQSILAERYARGEISHDEYRERLAHLEP